MADEYRRFRSSLLLKFRKMDDWGTKVDWPEQKLKVFSDKGLRNWKYKNLGGEFTETAWICKVAFSSSPKISGNLKYGLRHEYRTVKYFFRISMPIII